MLENLVDYKPKGIEQRLYRELGTVYGTGSLEMYSGLKPLKRLKHLSTNVLELNSFTLPIPSGDISQIRKVEPVFKVTERVDLSHLLPHVNVDYSLKELGREDNWLNITKKLKKKCMFHYLDL